MEAPARHPACIYHRAGKCSKGDACVFAHDADTPSPSCKFYKKGVCRYGDECLYTHDLEASQTEAPPQKGDAPQSTAPPPEAPKVAPPSADNG